MMSCEMILSTPNAENIGISVAELWGVENPDTFTIDTSRTRQTIRLILLQKQSNSWTSFS